MALLNWLKDERVRFTRDQSTRTRPKAALGWIARTRSKPSIMQSRMLNTPPRSSAVARKSWLNADGAPVKEGAARAKAWRVMVKTSPGFGCAAWATRETCTVRPWVMGAVRE